MAYAIEIHNLVKKYTDFALDNISLTVPQGCIMGIIGENGAGKTSLIKLMLDVIQRDSGEIRLLDRDVQAGDRNLKEHIGVVLDDTCFPDNFLIREVDTVLKRIYRTWDSERFFSYLNQFELPEQKKIKECSKGMKMKLSITAALSHDSTLLILDEATGGLDPIIRDEILDIFLEFIQDETHTIFISSHIISDLEKICDYITFIHKGKILFTEEKDVLHERYGILKSTEDSYASFDTRGIIGSKKNEFGIESLVLKEYCSASDIVDKASIEDIMLFFVRGK